MIFHGKNGCKNACGVATSGHDGTGTKKWRSSKKWFLTIKKVRKSFIFDLNIILGNSCSKTCPILLTCLHLLASWTFWKYLHFAFFSKMTLKPFKTLYIEWYYYSLFIILLWNSTHCYFRILLFYYEVAARIRMFLKWSIFTQKGSRSIRT